MKKLSLIVLLIVGCWIDADLNGLNDAVYHGDIKTVKRLINNGKDVNCKGWDGDIPLSNTIQGGIVIILLDAEVDINNNFVWDAFYKMNLEILIILCSDGDKHPCNQAFT